MQETTHILVIDDEADAKLMFKHSFRKEIKAKKYTFKFALSAKEALAYLESAQSESVTESATDSTKVALILSDINMPGMNGLALLKIIRVRYPQLPVLMVTAYGDENSKRIAEQYGASGFINKPIDFETLKKDITKLYR